MSGVIIRLTEDFGTSEPTYREIPLSDYVDERIVFVYPDPFDPYVFRITTETDPVPRRIDIRELE